MSRSKAGDSVNCIADCVSRLKDDICEVERSSWNGLEELERNHKHILNASQHCSLEKGLRSGICENANDFKLIRKALKEM
ncbi:hypothetical protein VNO78_23790 [Psophocarpus tetragonolobus]|uniref:Uncharacterized protein n=1 Tax=Psophocarpus tetragonolobus TaxID=3891 RepID=A0AAN9S7B8_PSOTE